jgi:hypothetical protein
MRLRVEYELRRIAVRALLDRLGIACFLRGGLEVVAVNVVYSHERGGHSELSVKIGRRIHPEPARMRLRGGAQAPLNLELLLRLR